MTKDIVMPSPKEQGYSIDISVSQDAVIQKASQRDINIQKVLTNHKYWYRNSNFLSTNNFDDPDFLEIVKMGEDAVPGILQIIREQPDPVVYALDRIFPHMMTYKGYIPLEDVCKLWLITLTAIGKA